MEAKAVETVETAEPRHPRWFTTGMVIGGAMLLALLIGLYKVLFVGHSALASTDDVPWNMFIVLYAYFISSIGLSYIASFGIIFGFKQFDVIARRALFLALVLIVIAMASVVVDMGNPLRAIYTIIFFSPTSALAVVALSINVYMLLVAAELYLLIKRRHDDRLLRFVAAASFFTAIIVHSYHGAIFGLTAAKDVWYGPYYPIYFLLSALYASAAIILLAVPGTYAMTGKEISPKLDQSLVSIGKMLIVLLGIGMFFLFWKTFSGYYAGKAEIKILTAGAYKINFWLFEVLIGFVIPFIMLMYAQNAQGARRLNTMALASVLVLVGLFAGRYDFIIVGQLIPSSSKLLSGLGSGGDYMTSLASYSPNLTEILTTIGLLGVIWVAYLLGVRYLPLDEDEQ